MSKNFRTILVLLIMIFFAEGLIAVAILSAATAASSPVAQSQAMALDDNYNRGRVAANATVNRDISLSFQNQSWTLVKQGEFLSEPAIGQTLLKIAKELNRKPQNAKFRMEGERVAEFLPHKSGQAVDLAESRRQILQTLGTNKIVVALAVVVNRPKTELKDLNNLGITELIARGQSDFSGSSSSRIQNVTVGASRYRGLIIQPGEEFSFNKRLGPIDAAHGYLPELVIKPEGTVPEFGGGLCQVSSTAFRAAFFAGLPITQRRNHSYAVKYYEWIADDVPRAVGLDATIYPGAQDMKFINDTPAAILVWTEISGNRLYFDFYGAPDGRRVVVDGPHPYDKKPNGAVKSTVKRQVITADGEIKEQTLNSNYVSPNLFPKVYQYPKPEEQPPEPSPAQSN